MTKLEELFVEQVELTKKILSERRRVWNARAPKLVGKYYGHVCRKEPIHWDDHKAVYYKITRCSKDTSLGNWRQIEATEIEIIPPTGGDCLVYKIAEKVILRESPEEDLFEEITKDEWDEVCGLAIFEIHRMIAPPEEV